MIKTPLGQIENECLNLPEKLTQASLSQVKFESLKSLPKVLSVKFDRVEKCDSIGVAALLWLYRESVRLKTKIVWQNIPDFLNKVLDLYQLNEIGLIQNERSFD